MISKLYTVSDLPIFFLDKCGRNLGGGGREGRGVCFGQVDRGGEGKWSRHLD